MISVISYQKNWHVEFWIFVLTFSTALVCGKQQQTLKIRHVQTNELPWTLENYSLRLFQEYCFSDSLSIFRGRMPFSNNLFFIRFCAFTPPSPLQTSLSLDSYLKIVEFHANPYFCTHNDFIQYFLCSKESLSLLI